MSAYTHTQTYMQRTTSTYPLDIHPGVIRFQVLRGVSRFLGKLAAGLLDVAGPCDARQAALEHSRCTSPRANRPNHNMTHNNFRQTRYRYTVTGRIIKGKQAKENTPVPPQVLPEPASLTFASCSDFRDGEDVASQKTREKDDYGSDLVLVGLSSVPEIRKITDVEWVQR